MTRYLITFDNGMELDISVSDDVSFDDMGSDTFDCLCNDTGEMLRVNGWLACDIIDWSAAQ